MINLASSECCKGDLGENPLKVVNMTVGFQMHFHYFPGLLCCTSKAFRSLMPASLGDSQEII